MDEKKFLSTLVIKLKGVKVMKFSLFIFLLVSILVLGGCIKKEDKVVTKEEKTVIKEIAGETEAEQEIYVQTMNEVSSEDTLNALEKELNDTVILEEDFSDL